MQARFFTPFKEVTMSKGKFSSPRPHREEDPEIKRVYRQMTGQEPIPEPVPESIPEPIQRPQSRPSQNPGPEMDMDLDALLSGQQPEEPAAPPPVPNPPSPHRQPPRHRFFPEEEPMEEEESPEDAEPEDEDSFLSKASRFLDKAMDFCTKNRKVVLVSLCALALLIIVAFISIFAASTADPYDRKILSNVYVAGVNVGGMTKKEAINVVRQSADAKLAQTDMVVDLAGSELRISPADANIKLDVKSAVNAAYDYGRTGTNAEKDQAYMTSLSEGYTVPLSPYLDINKQLIQKVLEDFAASAGNTLTQTQYGLEGTQPELSADKFDKNAPGQTLVIIMGTPGIKIDTPAVLDRILDAYGRFEFTVTVENVEPTAQPNPLDLDAVYLEFYIAPVDAKVDVAAHKTIPASYGYGFDVEKAKAMVAQADYGQEVRIPMEYIEPEIMDDELLYRDTLGEYQTAYNRSENRIVNLQQACKAIDGFVLDPGETFSFNDVVGQCTTAKGYKYAYVGTGVEEESVLGGGISQVASTLYYCALLSDLQITTRYNHDLPMSYIDYGLDADVQWNSRDFKFKNTTSYPITIRAEATGGYVTVRILGTDQRSYYVRLESRIENTYAPDTKYEDYRYDNPDGYKDGDVLQEGQNGYLVRSYLLKYDRNTNELLSRDKVADSEYKSVTEILARVEPEPTQPSTQPSTPPSESSGESSAPSESSGESSNPSESSGESSDPSESSGESSVSSEASGEGGDNQEDEEGAA